MLWGRCKCKGGDCLGHFKTIKIQSPCDPEKKHKCIKALQAGAGFMSSDAPNDSFGTECQFLSLGIVDMTWVGGGKEKWERDLNHMGKSWNLWEIFDAERLSGFSSGKNILYSLKKESPLSGETLSEFITVGIANVTWSNNLSYFQGTNLFRVHKIDIWVINTRRKSRAFGWRQYLFLAHLFFISVLQIKSALP